MSVSRSVRTGVDEEHAVPRAAATANRPSVRWRFMRHESYHCLLGRDVALTRPHDQVLVRHAYLDGVDLAVAERWSEGEPVLPMEFLGHAREQVREVGGIAQFPVSAAGFVGELAQARVRRRDLRLAVAALLDVDEAQGIDHDVGLAGTVH